MNKKISICYDTDASRLIGRTEKVAFPKKIEEVQKLVSSSKLDIVPRGAGTGLVGGCIPDGSLIIDMGKMNKLSEFNPVKKTIRVEAGVTLKELNEELNSAGFDFPMSSFNYGISTIGGMIAKNIFNGVGFESMKNLIEEIEFVNGRGEIMKTSKADLMDVCSMEGITGIIVATTLKIIPKIEKTASIFQTESLDEALSTARRLKLEKGIVMLELFPPKVSKLLGLQEKYHIIIEFNSNRGKVKGENYKKISELKDRVYFALYSKEYFNSEDYKFFFDNLKEFILFLESMNIPYFSFLGTGIIRPFFRDDELNKKEEVIRFIKRIRAKQGGYGIGLTRKYLLDSFETKIIKRVKLRHDPFGRLNYGKVVEGEITLKRYASKKEAQHLEPMKEEEVEQVKNILDEKIEDIEPSLGEEISASKFKEELETEEIETPEEKMGEFIEEVKLIDETEEKEEEKILDLTLDDEEQKAIKDYQQTFTSEQVEKKREDVEQFARNVAKNISSQEVRRESKENPNVELRGKLSEEDKDIVNKVMFGGFGLNNKKEKKEDEE
jgi:FAD/FMN-containing dehydrogenase